LFLGVRFKLEGDPNDIFNSGGPGYTLNKAALKTLVAYGIPNYFTDTATSKEDVMVTKILREFNVTPYETKDKWGGERYMHFSPEYHYKYRLPPWEPVYWYARYQIDIKEGLDHCAARSIAFHYVDSAQMRRFNAILYGLCPPDRPDPPQE
jgi:glycoprotein-N-acetylgalactosamine 3-beta-galactosyltransferase